MSIRKSLKNAMLTGAGLVAWQNNAPVQYNGRQRQYFGDETRTFTQMMAQYSSDFVEAQMQGIDPENPLEYQTRFIRMADVVKPTAAIQRRFDDYKMLLVADRDIDYLMPGSKVVAMGSTWLVVNPLNVSGSDGMSLVRRCNAVWNHLDYYGNVVSEPIIVENQRANANDSDAQNSQLISKGYFNVFCQYNDATRQIDTNTRLILGTGAYRVTGYSDFETEFTGDYSTVRTVSFTVRYEEPNDAIDDMVNHVAGGKVFSWDVGIDAPAKMTMGQTTAFAAFSERCNVPVESTEEYPVYYEWESSDESVATVDGYGNVTAVAEGQAVITVTLAQNEAYSAAASVEVTETADGVDFTTTVPVLLAAYESTAISAAYFEDGAETDEPIVWTLTGADEGAYSYLVSTDGKSVSIDCFGYSKTPLTVTASYGEYSVSAQIELEGM